MASRYIKGPYKKDRERLFTKACSDRTRGNGFRLKEGRFTLNFPSAMGGPDEEERWGGSNVGAVPCSPWHAFSSPGVPGGVGFVAL